VVGVSFKEIRLDALRQISQIIDSSWEHGQEAYVKLNEEVARIPESDQQKETALLLRIRQLSYEARNSSKKDLEAKITQLISQEKHAGDMPMNYRVLRLFTIVEYLMHSGVQGDLLNEYAGMLTERMRQADFKLYAINNMLLNETAEISMAGGNVKAAVEADKELVDVIKALEERYHKNGRIYRNYNTKLYTTYRRLLCNFAALTPEEIEKYHAKMQHVISIDPDARKMEEESHLGEMYYAMATKNYAKALPLIKQKLNSRELSGRRYRLIQWMGEAAEKVGDKETQIEALRLYNQMLVHRDSTAISNRLAELEIRTKVNELTADKELLKSEKDREELESYRRLMSFVIVSWLLFAILLVILLLIWGKYRMTYVHVRSFVDNLIVEGEYLKRSLYHDYHAKGLEKFDSKESRWKIVGKRVRGKSIIHMFEYILNDIFYIASIGKSTRNKFIRPINVADVVNEEAKRASESYVNTTSYDIKLPAEELEIRTDKECLEYVLRHIFFAADRVNDGGTIRLEVKDDKENSRVQFVFYNRSVVVPDGNEEEMFDNFIDLQKLRKRDDCGLFLARMCGFLIDSSIRIDKECREGSSYIFSVSKVLGR